MIKNKITLLGREFRFGLGFLNKLIEGTGKDLATIGQESQTNRAVIVPLLMYYSLIYSYERQGIEVDFDKNDIYDLIDENGGLDGDFWTAFISAFNDSLTKDVPEDKKKVAKTKK